MNHIQKTQLTFFAGWLLLVVSLLIIVAGIASFDSTYSYFLISLYILLPGLGLGLAGLVLIITAVLNRNKPGEIGEFEYSGALEWPEKPPFSGQKQNRMVRYLVSAILLCMGLVLFFISLIFLGICMYASMEGVLRLDLAFISFPLWLMSGIPGVFLIIIAFVFGMWPNKTRDNLKRWSKMGESAPEHREPPKKLPPSSKP